MFFQKLQLALPCLESFGDDRIRITNISFIFYILGDILPEEPAAVAVRRVYTGSSVAVPDPDPSDPYVFGPLGSGSGSTSQRYGSASGSFYHAKIVRKTLIPAVLCLLFDFFILEK
jgi:hypothetical protein